ncbi:hypothetical protein [Capnocytophaga sputigena]|uniref:Lipoprotein n=1 Tax=Capnocytophaga sputigena TaxID=1019 RepID=A0AAX2IA20_CAPSP|nr:hypothetical protein [Capnocytophaga sputigena]ATA85055.1 hypothetical protein CGC55_11400 [Capnocytophaga sputigena]SQA74855.1 Uncharacterised protein [Capnocytophaga sputigena]
MKTYIILLVTVFSLFACHKENGQKEIQQDCYTPPTLEIYINKDSKVAQEFLLATGKVDSTSVSYINPKKEEKSLKDHIHIMDQDQDIHIHIVDFSLYTGKKDTIVLKNKNNSHQITILGKRISEDGCTWPELYQVWIDGKSVDKKYFSGFHLRWPNEPLSQ